MRAGITPTVTDDASQRAPDSMAPPKLSTCSAIFVASLVSVPLVNKFAVMSASPANWGGSTSPPFLINSWADTSGVSDRSTTITRSPFANVCSEGLGNVAERGAAGGGGVACGVWPRTPTGRRNKQRPMTRLILMLPSLLLHVEVVSILT